MGSMWSMGSLVYGVYGVSVVYEVSVVSVVYGVSVVYRVYVCTARWVSSLSVSYGEDEESDMLL